MNKTLLKAVTAGVGFGLLVSGSALADEKRRAAKVDAKAAALSKPAEGAASVPLSAKATGSLGIGALRDRAKKGDPRAQYMMGRRYDTGRGVKRNRQAAFGWFEMAARGRIAAAHYKIGLMHLTGELGAPDLIEAYARFKVAAKGGDVRATAMLFYIGPRMNAVELQHSRQRFQALIQARRQTAIKAASPRR